jgi:hypothetical protein
VATGALRTRLRATTETGAQLRAKIPTIGRAIESVKHSQDVVQIDVAVTRAGRENVAAHAIVVLSKTVQNAEKVV